MRASEHFGSVGDAETLAAMSSELAELARAKSVGDYRAIACPAIRAQLGVDVDGENSPASTDALRQGLEEAIDRVPDQQYREAVVAILGFTGNRWTSLRTRQVDAARAFGIGYDAFRRRRSGGRPSLYEQCLRELALVVLDADHASQPEADGAEPTAPPPPVGGSKVRGEQVEELPQQAVLTPVVRRRSTKGRCVAVRAIAGLVAVAVGILIGVRIDPAAPETTGLDLAGELDVDRYCEATFGDESNAVRVTSVADGWRCSTDGNTAEEVDFSQACVIQYGTGAKARLGNFADPFSWTCYFDVEPMEVATNGCPFDAGAYLADAQVDFSRYAQKFLHAYERRGGHAKLGCPATPLYQRGDGIAQDLALDGTVDGAMYLVDTRDSVVILTTDVWDAYQRVGGGVGLSTVLLGLPVTSEEFLDGAWQVQGSAGGALVAQDAGGPYYLVPHLSYGAWMDEGGPTGALGMPVSDPYPAEESIQQDFEHGHIVFSAAGVEAHVITVDS